MQSRHPDPENAVWNFPAAHVSHRCIPGATYVPGEHNPHSSSDWLPFPPVNLPTGHTSHIVRPRPGWYLLSSHCKQPTPHTWYVPLAHDEQTVWPTFE
jgi:hypothetical protein